jgi:hypothetical protein
MLKLKIWLYKHLRARFARLEREVIQAYEYEKAELAQKKFRRNMTASRYRTLTSRPDQEECGHLKGHSKWYGSSKFPRNDYAISWHIHADAHHEVKCMICGKQFDPKDPETRRMMDSSTNSITASEVGLFIPRKAQ